MEPGRLGIQQLLVVEAVDAGVTAVDEVQRQDRHEHRQAAGLGEQEELDRGRCTVLMAPDRDEKVHGNQHQLPEEVEQEEIQGHEDAHDSGQRQHEAQVKRPYPLLDLGPRGADRRNPEEDRQGQKQQAQAIDSQMKAHPERLNPRIVKLMEPRPAGCRGPGKDQQNRIHEQGGERHPAAGRPAPPAEHPGGHRPCERHDEQPQQDHKNTTSPTTMTAPAAMLATYHRTFPLTVRDRSMLIPRETWATAT